MTAVTECASARSVCPVRRVLTERFRILLDRHNLKFLNCIDRMGLDEAVKRTQPEFDECVAARGAVEAHAEEHGCVHVPRLPSFELCVLYNSLTFRPLPLSALLVSWATASVDSSIRVIQMLKQHLFSRKKVPEGGLPVRRCSHARSVPGSAASCQ